MARDLLLVSHMTNSTSTDATRGQPIGQRVRLRIEELEAALAKLSARETIERNAIELALSNVYALVTGDLDHPSEPVARDLSAWLERHKYLGETTPRAGVVREYIECEPTNPILARGGLVQA